MTDARRRYEDFLKDSLDAHSTALGALTGLVLEADPRLVENAARFLEQHLDENASQRAAQLLRRSLATHTARQTDSTTDATRGQP